MNHNRILRHFHISYSSKDLGSDTVILLTFDDPTAVGSGLFKDKFPICWKYVSLSVILSSTPLIAFRVAGMPGKGLVKSRSGDSIYLIFWTFCPGPGQFTVTYRSQYVSFENRSTCHCRADRALFSLSLKRLAFTKPQVDSKNMISAGTYVDIDVKTCTSRDVNCSNATDIAWSKDRS